MSKPDEFIPVARVCATCGRPFLAQRRYQMFDSAACRMAARADYKDALLADDLEKASKLFWALYPDRRQA